MRIEIHPDGYFIIDASDWGIGDISTPRIWGWTEWKIQL